MFSEKKEGIIINEEVSYIRYVGYLFDTEVRSTLIKCFAQENIEFTYADYIKYAGTSQKNLN